VSTELYLLSIRQVLQEAFVAFEEMGEVSNDYLRSRFFTSKGRVKESLS